jgi:phenylalanine-4-hydroxylase
MNNEDILLKIKNNYSSHPLMPLVSLEANYELKSDHIGFHDPEYRKRRQEIIQLSKSYNDELRNYPVIDYLSSESQTWTQVFDRLQELYPSVAEESYLKGLNELKEKNIFRSNQIPNLKLVSEFLEKKTGFRLYPVSGLLSPKQFLQGLASKIFFCTQYIRHPSKPFYTPEPDIIHEMLGHVPMFLNPKVCEISEMIGKAALLCSENKLSELEKLYWFTIEFGVMKNKRIYGAGILSSIAEIEKVISGFDKIVKPFDVDRILSDHPLITEFQNAYYSIESFDDLRNRIEKYLINYL